jgi:hypothetical protein
MPTLCRLFKAVDAKIAADKVALEVKVEEYRKLQFNHDLRKKDAEHAEAECRALRPYKKNVEKLQKLLADLAAQASREAGLVVILPELELRVHVYALYPGRQPAQAIVDRVIALLKDAALTPTGWTQAGLVFYDTTTALPLDEIAQKLEAMSAALAELSGEETPDFVIEGIHLVRDAGDREALAKMYAAAASATIAVLLRFVEEEDPMQANARWN